LISAVTGADSLLLTSFTDYRRKVQSTASYLKYWEIS